MEIKFVDADHGYAAFAPDYMPSPSSVKETLHSFAYVAGDSIATEAPVVAWQQAISRWPTSSSPMSLSTKNSEDADNSCLEDTVKGGGIHTCCAYCLNSLISVEEELLRIKSIMEDSCNKSPNLNFESTQSSSQNALIIAMAIEKLMSNAIFVDKNKDNTQVFFDKKEDVDWSQWFMTAVPTELIINNFLSTEQLQEANRPHQAYQSTTQTAKSTEWCVLLRKIQTQKTLILYDESELIDEQPTSHKSESLVLCDPWHLTFCDEDCFAKHEREFRGSRWLSGIDSDHHQNPNTTNFAKFTERADIGATNVTHLLSQYLLFDKELIDSLNRSSSLLTNKEALSVDSKVTTLASNPLVGAVRSALWRVIEHRFIDRCSNDDDDGDENEEENRLEDYKKPSLSVGNLPPSSIDAASSARDALHRCLGVIHVLSGTFNERYKLIVMTICRTLTTLALQGPSDCNREGTVPNVSHSVGIKAILQNLEPYLQGQFCSKYEEGPYRSLSLRQRESMRVFTTLVNKWLHLLEMVECETSSCEEDNTASGHGETLSSLSPARYVSLQTIQMVSMVLDANVHSCVILSPWYVLASAETENETQTIKTDGSVSVSHLCPEHFADISLSSLVFRLASPVLLNNMGVALYDRCTKINHSCRPNVRFVPTFAPVRAHVIARGRYNGTPTQTSAALSPTGIRWGEELRTSYLDVDEEFVEGGEVCSRAIRREKLLRDYGFYCDCPRCFDEADKE